MAIETRRGTAEAEPPLVNGASEELEVAELLAVDNNCDGLLETESNIGKFGINDVGAKCQLGKDVRKPTIFFDGAQFLSNILESRSGLEVPAQVWSDLILHEIH